jgi:hypothetical protein
LKNVSDTEAYTVYDFIFSQTVRSLSNLVGVKKITRPFWDRWRASCIDDATIFRFLDGIGTGRRSPARTEPGNKVANKKFLWFAR